MSELCHLHQEVLNRLVDAPMESNLVCFPSRIEITRITCHELKINQLYNYDVCYLDEVFHAGYLFHM